MRRLPLLPIAALCLLTASSVLVAQSPPLIPFRGLIDHASADQEGGVPYNDVEIWHRAISGDGRYLVMSSRSSELAAGDYDDITPVFSPQRSAQRRSLLPALLLRLDHPGHVGQ